MRAGRKKRKEIEKRESNTNMKLSNLELTFNYVDGNAKELTIKGNIDHYGWQQWNETIEKLGANVDLIEALSKTVAENTEFCEKE